MNIINLTPHNLNIQAIDRTIKIYPPSGQIARIETKREIIDVVNGINVYRVIFGDLTELPSSKYNTIFIVSQLAKVAANAIGRYDVFSPGELVRDELGRIIGCDGFSA